MSRPSFREIADRVWVARSAWMDLNVTVVTGTAGALVVDTHGSQAEGARLVDDIARLGIGPVAWVINTHEHFDHTFGNASFLSAHHEVRVCAHEVAAANTVASGQQTQAGYLDESGAEYREEVCATTIVAATETFSSTRVISLGDRAVELVHPGRGHSGGDLVMVVPDAGVVVAGDLVEESGPPVYGADSWPMDWPRALDVVMQLTAPDAIVVPGHGALVDRAFVNEQRHDIGVVAETIRDLVSRGVPVRDALDSTTWPFPNDHLVDAVLRGYSQLPRTRQRLPLV